MNRCLSLVLAIGVGAGSAAPAAAQEIVTAVEEARWVLEPVGSREMWGPRTTSDRVRLLEGVVADAGAAEDPVAALARALVAQGKAKQAEAAYRGWASRHPVPAEGALRLGEWFVQRRRAKAALSAMEEAAKGRAGAERAAVYTRMLEVVERLRPADVDTLRLQEARFAAAPTERSHARALLDTLAARRGVDAAVTRLKSMAKEDPEAWVSVEVSLLEKGQRMAEARKLLEAEWDRRRDLASARQLGLFLRRTSAYEERAGELVEGWAADALSDDDLELAAHFRQLHPYDSTLRQLPELSVLVRALSERWEGRGAAALGRLGALWADAEEPGEALRAYLGALAATRGSAGEVAARRALVKAALDLDDPGGALRPAGAVATRPYVLDPHPGVVSGFASLLWSDLDASGAASQVSKNLVADAAAARVDAWLAKEWREAPGDPALADLLKRFVARLERRGMHLRGADVWLKFAEDTQDPEQAAGHRLEALKVLERAPSKVRDASRPALERWARKVMEEAEKGGWTKVSTEAFGMLERSLKARRDQAGVVALYRRELDKGDLDADTLERFLGLLTSYQMYGELDAVYDRALAAFPERTWFDKAARWYVRQKRHDAFADVSRRAVRELAPAELATYLGRRTRLSRSGRGAGRDRALYLELYRAANQRFPHDLRFVDGLLRYHDYFRQTQEAEDLAFRYGARRADLAERVWKARLQRGGLGGTVKALAAARSGSRAASILLARAHEWMSRYEEARPLWQELAAEIPDERQVLEAAARSLRSLGAPLEAVTRYQQLAAQEPGNREWPTLVGEMRIEGGDLEGAKEAWREIGRATPGDAEGWRVGATVLWDYYLFDDAVAILEEGRKVLDDARAFGTEMEALHEGRGAWEAAAREAVATLVHRGGHDWSMLERLGVLGRKGHDARIQAALAEAVDRAPDQAAPLQALLAVLDEWGREWPVVRGILTELVPRLSGRQPLQVVLSRARGQEDVELEGLVLGRLAAVRGREPRALLDLMAFAGRGGDSARVSALAREIHVAAEALPASLRGRAVRLFERLGQALWRHGDRDQALVEWRAGVGRARGEAARSQRLALARRLVEAGRADAARKELETLLEADPGGLEPVYELAAVSLREGRGEDLVPLYEAAEARVKAAPGLSRETRKLRRQELQRRLVADLRRAGRGEELGPRLGELVLGDRENEGLAQDAWRLARVSGQTAALLAPLERYAKDSPKDFRAHRILAWMAELAGDLEQAAEHMGRAVAEEPQRVDLRRRRLDVLLRQGAFEAARQELAALEARSPQGPIDHAEDRARLERLAGRPVAAREALELLLPENLSSEEEARRMERFAEAMWQGGDVAQAWKALDKLMGTLERDGPLVWSPNWGDARRWLEWTRVVHGSAEAFRRSQRVASRLRLKGGDGYPARVRGWTADWLDGHRNRALLEATRDGGPARDRTELHAVLRDAGSGVLADPQWALPRAGYEDLVHGYLSQWNDDDLWTHLHRSGRLDELDSKLSAAQAKGKSGEQARKATRLARLRRERNQPAQELAALRAAPHARGPSWYLSDTDRRRMLDLVLDLAGQDALARELSGRGLWGLNEALRREQPQLALRLLEEHFGPSGAGSSGDWVTTTRRWKRDAHTRIAAAFDLPPAGVESAYDGLLDRRPVGPRLASPPDPKASLVGGGYFPAAVRLARWLLARGRKDEARGFAAALAEGKPRDVVAELETAALLFELGDTGAARRRLASAVARKPGDRGVVERALVLRHAWGERDEALASLRFWGGPEALTQGRWRDLLRIGDALGETKTVVGWLQEQLASAGSEVALDWLEEAVEACEARMELAERSGFRQVLLKAWRDEGPRAELLARRPGAAAEFRLEALGHALAAFDRAPARVRLDYQRRMAAAAALAGDKERTRRALAALTGLVSEIEAGGGQAPDLRLERAERRFAIGDQSEAQALLDAYLGSEEEVGSSRGRWVGVHRVLQGAGRDEDAAALRRRYYRARERLGGGRSKEVLAGLVREALGAGDKAEARVVAERLASLDPDDGEALGWLGRTLAGAGLAAEGATYLERATRVRPGDLELRLALGEAQLARPESLKTGLATLARVVVDRRASQELRRNVMAALRRAAPGEADLRSHWRPSLPDATGRSERLWGEAEAATGRGEFELAAQLYQQAGEADPVATDPWKQLVRLYQREAGGDEAKAAVALSQLQRREAPRGRASRFTRHRLFWARVKGGGAAGSLYLLDLDGVLGQLQEAVERDSEDAAWAKILGSSDRSRYGGYYRDVSGGHDHGGDAGGGLGLPGWGGDAGVDVDPFASESPPGTPEEVMAASSEGLPPGPFLMAVARARKEAGDLEGASRAFQLAADLGAEGAPTEIGLVQRAIEMEEVLAERRLVLASE